MQGAVKVIHRPVHVERCRLFEHGAERRIEGAHSDGVAECFRAYACRLAHQQILCHADLLYIQAAVAGILAGLSIAVKMLMSVFFSTTALNRVTQKYGARGGIRGARTSRTCIPRLPVGLT